jgi:hypothetical protein
VLRALLAALALVAAPAVPSAPGPPDLRVAGVTLTREVPRRGLAQFSVTIHNDGASTATSVRVTIEPRSVRTDAVPGTCSGDPIVCSIGSIPPGGRVDLSLAARAPQPGDLTIAVVASAAEADDDRSDNRVELRAAVSPCTAFGVAGHDRLVGRLGADHLCGRAGNDVIDGRAGPDVLEGGAGNDRITGGAGRDLLLGGGGRDRLLALDHGRDAVDCGAGSDVAHVDATDLTRRCERVVRRGRVPR